MNQKKNMVITKTPLRITLGGGGTDLPSYYSLYEGFVLSAAINKYIYITLHRTFVEQFIAKYSQVEIVDDINNLKHPIIKQALRYTQTDYRHLEMTSLADIPARTGLGSSGSFTVSLLQALYTLNGFTQSASELAEHACHLEIDCLNEPVGKQDQYIAALGGLQSLYINQHGKVSSEPLKMHPDIHAKLEQNLLLFYTGLTRQSSIILSEQKQKSLNNDVHMLEGLTTIKNIGLDSKQALEQGDLAAFAELMNVHWRYKKKRSQAMSDGSIEQIHQHAMSNHALGGKLVGAGGGGFLLYYTEQPEHLRKAMQDINIPEVPFQFEPQGSHVLVHQ